MPARPYLTPGVYVEEISTLPPSIAEVATAIPAFIGYTRKGPANAEEPWVRRISSMLEFTTAFGGAAPAEFIVTQPAEGWSPAGTPAVTPKAADNPFSLYYALSHYFKNGGGPCFVVSVGKYEDPAKMADRFAAGLDALERQDEPTLIVLTDAACLLPPDQYYGLCVKALQQCKRLGDRFTIVDVLQSDTAESFRKVLAADLEYLMYGAAYHPYLRTTIPYQYEDTGVTVYLTRPDGAELTASLFLPSAGDGIVVRYTGPKDAKPKVTVLVGESEPDVKITVEGDLLTIYDAKDAKGTEIVEAWNKTPRTGAATRFEIATNGSGESKITRDRGPTDLMPEKQADDSKSSLAMLKDTATAIYNRVQAALDSQYVVLPPSAAMAGVYARVDRDHGVWKAPANVTVMAVLGPAAKITDQEQEGLNVDTTGGKSINAIRDFTGKGTLVWGSRTLAGNDNEWRYVPVRRLFITIEESAKKASAFAVFEPNDQATWLKVKAMIESYLYGLWERGALAGAKPEQAYYVHVGLGTTMTPQDILEGRMIVEIGIAAVRPAEFVVLRFSHKLQTA